MKSFKDFISENTLKENKGEDFLNSLDLKAAEKSVNDFVKKTIGVDAGIKLAVIDGRRGKTIEISSTDIANKIGVKVFKSLKVQSNGSNATGNGTWYLGIDYRWEQFGGGSNGTTIAHIEFDATGKITASRVVIK